MMLIAMAFIQRRGGTMFRGQMVMELRIVYVFMVLSCVLRRYATVPSVVLGMVDLSVVAEKWAAVWIWFDLFLRKIRYELKAIEV
jgi:hypothetical protein